MLFRQSETHPRLQEKFIWKLRNTSYHSSSWKWTESNPWPPIASVLSAGLWTHPELKTVRDRLSAERPDPIIETGDGNMVTINMSAALKNARSAFCPKVNVRRQKILLNLFFTNSCLCAQGGSHSSDFWSGGRGGPQGAGPRDVRHGIR